MPDTDKTGRGIPSPFPPPIGPPTPTVEQPPQPSDADLPPLDLSESVGDIDADNAFEVDPNAGQVTPPQSQAQEQGQPQTVQGRSPVTLGGMYFQSGDFFRDIADFSAYAYRKTGYSNLDAIQPFYPGLYVLGAISSLGKTTFSGQMADQLAANGEDVLYFSLEQSRFELFSKSLSRIFCRFADEMASQKKYYPRYTSMELRQGRGLNTAELQDVIDEYTQTIGNRMVMIDKTFHLTVEDIYSTVTTWIKTSGRKPVVIIDYLQIIAPSMIGGRIPDTKTSIDHIVHTIKSFQSALQLSVLLISSLNRQNYMTPIDFESFKESGGIEYTADVLWGLQLLAIHDDIFSKEGRIGEKRELIRQAKSASPRAIELVCLKNRYGISNYGVHYDYYPAYDTFKVIDNQEETP